MKSSRARATCVFCAALALFACSSSDTIVSLNVESASDVGFVSKLHVKFTQGTRAFETDLEMLATKTVGEAGATSMVIADKLFKRVSLPDAFKDGAAEVDVQAFDASASPSVHPKPVAFQLHEHEVTAVVVKLAQPETPPIPEGGAGGASDGEGGTGGTATSAGGAGGAG